MLRVLIVGGYGNFGGYVARALAGNEHIQLLLAGRSESKALAAAAALDAINPAIGVGYDMEWPPEAMAAHKPGLVINIVGPYHPQSYAVAQAAIACGAHYCDIADAREFVCGIGVLDESAQSAEVTVLAGASSVPALTAAYCDEALKDLAVIESIVCGISGAEQANRGAGTVAAVLSYVGERFTHLSAGAMKEVRGWAGLHSVRYPELGRRWFGYGNVPDLGLFPARYKGLQNQSFWAGHEIPFLHFGTWLTGIIRRAGLLPRLDRFAFELARFSRLFNWMGRSRSGFHMVIEGQRIDGSRAVKRHWVIARQGHGPIIPCIPVILIARKMAAGERFAPGARPCLDVINLDEYRAEFAGLDITCIDE